LVCLQTGAGKTFVRIIIYLYWIEFILIR
jgi:hypothetical protein